MKTIISSKSSEQGTTLLVALFLTTILAVTIAGYLKHAYQQQYLSTRSQVWNSSIAVTEAGVEEALQHLNTNPTNLTANGWAQSGSTYTMSRQLTSTARYTVTINSANITRPEITSQAFMTDPRLAASATPTLAAVLGGTVSTVNQNEIVSRAVRVKCGKDGLFLKAMVAKHWIDMNGNNVMTDSFDSTKPAYSENGRYPSSKPWRLLDNGDVASNDSIFNVVNVGIANIYGRVAVGPGGTIDVKGGGVGTRAWQASNTGIQPGYFTDDMNFTFPSVTLPYTTGLTPSSGTVSTTNYSFSTSLVTIISSTYPSPVPPGGVMTSNTYVTVSSMPSPIPFGTVTNTLSTATSSSAFPAPGTYVGTPTKKGSKWYYDVITGYNYTYPKTYYVYSTDVTTTNYTVTTDTYDYILPGSAANMPPLKYYVDSLKNAKVLVQGNAQLVVRNDIKFSGQDGIWLGSNGKLEMWVGGTSADISGQGIFNPTGYAKNFLLWAADSVTDLKLSGNGEFTGIIVAPNANVTLNGGGSTKEDYIGSLIGNTIKMNGHYKFHYDEALKNLDKDGRYKVTEWNEISIAKITSVTY
jgi:hypothetical protein